MKCIWPKEHVQVIDYEIKWTLNGNVILNSDKRKITPFYNETTYKIQQVTTPLRLHYIVLPDESYNVDKKKYVKHQSHRSTGIEKFDLVDEVFIWMIRQMIEIFLLVLTLFVFWMLCIYSFSVLEQLKLTLICKNIMKLADFGVESSRIVCLSSISTTYATMTMMF